MLEALHRRLLAYAEKDGRGYPDWALRYMPLVRRLRRRGALAAAGQILEIGANENGLARFAGVRVIVVDADLASLRSARQAQDVLPVAADAAALPFRAGAMDLCVCIDTLEHIATERRPEALEEAARVLAAPGTAAIAFPSGEAAARAERRVREAYRRHTGREFRWFSEHAAQELPDAEDATTTLRQCVGDARRVTLGENANLWLWHLMWRVLICGWPGRGNALFQALLRLCTPLLCRVHLGVCYRRVIWIEPEDF